MVTLDYEIELISESFLERRNTMAKKYDLIIVGAGPAGLMAAKTAGENGLNVALLERKTNVTSIKRACAQMLLIFNDFYFGERMKFNPRNGRLSFPVNGFSVKYDGPSLDLYGFRFYSPDGSRIELSKTDPETTGGKQKRLGLVHDKSLLLEGLLTEAKTNGVEIFPGVNVTHMEKKEDGVLVIGNGKQYNATFALGADGCNSRLAELLGFNQNREFYGTLVVGGLEMEGVELPGENFNIFILNYVPGPSVFFLCNRAGDERTILLSLAFDPELDHGKALDYLIHQSPFMAWFKKAKKLYSVSAVENCYAPITEPFKDNILFIGDTSWCQEAENMGSLMCGWKAAHALTQALLEGKSNREGILSYLEWWKKSFVKHYDHTVYLRNFLFPYVLDEGAANYIFSLVKETLPATLDAYLIPQVVGGGISKVMAQIAEERPEIPPKIQRFATAPLNELIAELTEKGFSSQSKEWQSSKRDD
jgi:digeranylgeranylglycerophospholipid reductase